MLYSGGSGVSSVHVVLSVLRSRSLSFVHLSMSCRLLLLFALGHGSSQSRFSSSR